MYGPSPAIDVIMSLFIDDGISDRGHRNNLFKNNIYLTGNFQCPHKDYSYMTCMTYATAFELN